MRAPVALVALGAIAAILWLFYSAQPHPVGTLGYDYLNEFPGYLATLVIVGLVLVLRLVFGGKKIKDFTRLTHREAGNSSKNVH
jgi:hypothetical protein